MNGTRVAIFAGAFAFAALVTTAILFPPRLGALGRLEKLQSELIENAKDIVKAGLSDPYSAQFESLRLVGNPGKQSVCGLVNAKNKFGGYVGSTPFVVNEFGNAYLLKDEAARLSAGEHNVKPCFPTMMDVPKRN